MRSWMYFSNPFLKAVKNNYKKAIQISTFTDSRLQAKQNDEFYGPLYNRYHPFHVEFLTKYNAWRSQGGMQKGATLSLNQLLKLLSPSKINAWDLSVMNIYDKGSADYLTIFPQGHKPFQSGEKLQRINALKQLTTALTGRESLALTLADVQAFYNQLLEASTTQQGQKGNTDSHSNEVMQALTEAMITLYSILGSCIQTFPDNPSVCESIFDMQTIRDREQVVYTGSLHPQEQHNVLERTFAATDELTLSSNGNSTLNFFMAAKANAPLNGSPVVAVNSQESKTIFASEFGDLSNRFLNVINTSANVNGAFKLELE